MHYVWVDTAKIWDNISSQALILRNIIAMNHPIEHAGQPETSAGPKTALPLTRRIKEVISLLAGIRPHDLRAARTFVGYQYANVGVITKWVHFLGWSLKQICVTIPNAMPGLIFPRSIDRTPFWLTVDNPLENHPWSKQPDAKLPADADTVVIGAGFTGASAAYHWSRKASPDKHMVVVEMSDAAHGASGRNQGTIVMGRFFAMVRNTVLEHFNKSRHDLDPGQRLQLAEQFADKYCRAAYRNAELIQQTIEQEGFDVDYARNGWVQERSAEQQEELKESVETGQRFGHTDWQWIDPDRVRRETGMRVNYPSGFSKGAGTWHPAKWVWSLLTTAMKAPNVSYYSRTSATRVERSDGEYLVRTSRGDIRARNVLYAVEAYLVQMDSRFHNVIIPHQEQLSCGLGGPEAMPSNNSITGRFYFGGRRDKVVFAGSDSTVIPDQRVGRNSPSRFLTKFALSEYKRVYGPYRFELTNEWAGSVGYSLDEYPLIGSIDGRGEYMIGGMCGSGSGVAFNAARCIVNRILGYDNEPDDYPEAYFAPSRLLDPQKHPWPEIKSTPGVSV